jgi:hypothetical protein
MTVDVTCPTCGTVSYFDEVNRDANAFCRVCDYPLFWVRSTAFAGVGDAEGGVGLRRLPGTAGRITVAMEACPECSEPNPVSVNICVRCGADMHPPPPPPPPPPEPEPEPEPVFVPPPPPPPPPARNWWPWVALGVLAVVAIVILVVLLA